MARLKSINHKGYINPLQKEYIKIFWKKKQELIHLNELKKKESIMENKNLNPKNNINKGNYVIQEVDQLKIFLNLFLNLSNMLSVFSKVIDGLDIFFIM